MLGPNLAHDYFWSSSGATIPYWRPLTKASWLVEYQLGGGATWPFFAVQLGWLLVALLGVQRLVRQLDGSPRAAAVAALLLALHPSLVEPVALVMARSDVAAGAGLILAVVGFVDWLRGARLGLVAHLLGVVLALGSKEASVVVAPLVVLLWLAIERPLEVRSLLRIAPSIVLVGVYLVLRRAVLADADPGALGFDLLRVSVAGAAYLRQLAPLALESSIRNLPRAEASSTRALVGSLVTWLALAALAAALLQRRFRRRDLRWQWLLLATLLPLAPVLLVKKVYVPSIEGKLPLADRWLLPSLLFSSVAMGLLFDRVARLRPRFGAALLLVVVGWAGARLLLVGGELAPYATELALLDKEDATFARTPEAYRTEEDRCRAADRQMIRAAARNDVEAAQASMRSRPSSCAARVDATFNLLSLLVRNRRFGDARPLVDALLPRSAELDERNLGPFAYLAGTVLAETGDGGRAERLLLEALARAVEQQGRTADAHTWSTRAQQCRAQPR